MSLPSYLLELAGTPGQLQVAFSEAAAESAAVRRVETHAADPAAVAALAASLHGLLDQTAAQRQLAGEHLAEARRTGQALWKTLIPPQAAARLRGAAGGHLTLMMDEALIAIPWELLHDGERFLGQRFAVGRIVRTGQAASAPPRPASAGRSLLLLANPTGDLPHSLAEQERILALARAAGEACRCEARSRGIDRRFVLASLPEWDCFHYSGHVEFEPGHPERSGLKLRDGLFTALDLQALTRAGRPLPAMVTINGCGSGRVEGTACQLSLFNLSNAFLLAGVRLFLGAVVDVADELAVELAIIFYRYLFKGMSAGEALRRAREEVMAALPALAAGALAYVLYGNPAFRPFALAEGAGSAEGGVRGAENDCTVCGRPILSRLASARHGCELCGAPICQTCWVARDARRCRQHATVAAPAPAPKSVTSAPPPSAPEPKPADPISSRCARCERMIPRGAASCTCEHEGCDAAICERCWRWLDRRTCAAHTLDWPARVAEARARLASGALAIVVDRQAAAQREAFYYGEVRARLAQAPAIVFGSERYAPARGALREESAQKELDALLARVSDGAAIAGQCPRNLALEARFQRGSLFGGGAPLILRLEVLADLERQVYPGFETTARGAAAVLDRIAHPPAALAEPGARLIHVLASVTGWDEGARQQAVGGVRGELRQESRHIFVLVDLESDEVISGPAHPLSDELSELIHPSARLSVAASLEAHIRQNLTAGEFMTAGELAQQFKIHPRQVAQVMQTLVAAAGVYELREVPGVGLAITKKLEL